MLEQGEGVVHVKATEGPSTYACFISFEKPIENQGFKCFAEKFVEEISGARTFASLKDVMIQRGKGYSKGSNTKNALLHEDGSWLVESLPLRYPNEPVRHKILDLFGDMALTGVRLKGSIYSNCGSHQLNTKLAEQVRNAYLTTTDPHT
jgi:UDP-3-O-[3-hydroxymyristoyl] N-acetylglucosamine deacetylase